MSMTPLEALQIEVTVKMFPIQDAEAIPWAVIAPCERQCKRNHGGQTLEGIAERGGLGAAEACDILLGLRWSTTRPADAVSLLREIVKDRWYLTEIERLRGEADDKKNWVSGAWAHSQQIVIDNLVNEAEQKDTTITMLRGDNLLLAKKVSALRKLNIAYRTGNHKLADFALGELETLSPGDDETT